MNTNRRQLLEPVRFGPCERAPRYTAAMSGLARPLVAVCAVLIALAGFVAGMMFARDPSPGPPAVASLVWPPAPPLEAFALVDQAGAVLDAGRLRGRWTLLFFGYTQCPDICPTTLATLADAYQRLRGDAMFARLGQVLFVSVDGERDTPEVLRAYTGHFNPDFIAASASAAELHLLTRQFGAQVVRVSGAEPSEYWFDHPSSVLLIDPALRVVGEFVPPLEARGIAEEVAAIVTYITSQR
jgi:protein SCO1